jgi:sigma-E factor negative regulatory protein RseC
MTMSERIGIVVENESGGFARIVTNRSSACSGCHTGSAGCGSCLANSKLVSLVADPVGAKPGDMVQVELNSKDLLKGAAVLYLLPVITLLAGALSGPAVISYLKWGQTTGGILGALLGLAIGFLLMKRIDRSRWARRKLVPSITAVIASTEDKKEPVSQAAHSCCG